MEVKRVMIMVDDAGRMEVDNRSCHEREIIVPRYLSISVSSLVLDTQ